MRYEFEAPAKDPAAVLNHAMDWSSWLEDGETISGTPGVTAASAELTIDQIAEDEGTVSWRVSGGVAGKDYFAICSIETSNGRRDERTVRYPVRQR